LIALAVAAPVLLLSGVSVAGFGVGAATWLVIRGLGAVLDHRRSVGSAQAQQLGLGLGLWLGYRLARILLLAGATIAVREAVDENAGITALAVVVSAFTIQLAGAVIDRYAGADHVRAGDAL
jgi:hypothetical protein